MVKKREAVTLSFAAIGWKSKAAAGDWDTPTASYVTSVVCMQDWRKYAANDLKSAIDNMSDDDASVASLALAWIRDKRATPDQLNDYLYNLLVACTADRIPAKHFGLVCSLIAAYMRDQEQEIERQERAKRPVSEHFGTVKKREAWKLLVTGVNYFEGDYGVTTFVRFRDEFGNVAIWKASGSKNMDVGSEYEVKGTVKEHSEYKGTKQTVLSRCVCEKILTEEEKESPEQNFYCDQSGHKHYI